MTEDLMWQLVEQYGKARVLEVIKQFKYETKGCKNEQYFDEQLRVLQEQVGKHEAD